MPTWLEMPEFDGLDLTESYVLGWAVTPEGLRFDLDIALAPSHPDYTPPPTRERDCYRRGTLLFPAAHSIRGLAETSQVVGAIDLSGERDYGTFDHLEANGGTFRLEGEFGTVTLLSDRPVVTFLPRTLRRSDV
jgi:hypothetical protein